MRTSATRNAAVVNGSVYPMGSKLVSLSGAEYVVQPTGALERTNPQPWSKKAEHKLDKKRRRQERHLARMRKEAELKLAG